MARCACLGYTLSISKDISLLAAVTLLENGQLDTEMCEVGQTPQLLQGHRTLLHTSLLSLISQGC